MTSLMVPGHDTVRICALTLPFFIGIHDYEKEKRQTVVIDIDMVVDEAVRRSGDYVSYSTVTDYAKSLSAAGEHIELVETLAGLLLDCVLSDKRVARARVSVLKSDIYPEAAGVGIVIEGTQDSVGG